MFRFSALLLASIFATLLIAGADRGQMRPGLARAIAAGQPIEVVSRQFSAPVVFEKSVEPRSASLPEPIAPLAPVPEPAPATLAAAADDPPTDSPPIFTLSALTGLQGDHARLGALPEDPAPQAVESDAVLDPDAQSQIASGEGLQASVWYVTAAAVNVRQGPSTASAVVERLVNGEAVTVLGDTSADWVRITIQGDGVDGWVATKLLSPY